MIKRDFVVSVSEVSILFKIDILNLELTLFPFYNSFV